MIPSNSVYHLYSVRVHKVNKPPRSGIAAVEFAIVLPLIVLLLVGAIEGARGVMVTHSLQEAAHAGCRVYSVEDTTLAQATVIIDQAMSSAGITGYTISFDPSTKAAVDTLLEPVTVTVSVPYSEVAWLPANFLAGTTLRGTSIMPADLDASDGGDKNGYAGSDDDHVNDGYLRYDNDDDD